MHPEIDQRTAPGGRTGQHPVATCFAVAIHQTANEPERGVLHGVSGRRRGDRVEHCGAAEHQRNRGEAAGGGGAAGDVTQFGRIDPARLLDGERDAVGDQMARRRGHVAVTAEHEGEVRPGGGAHLAIIGPGTAAGARRDLLRPGHVGIADTRHPDLRQRQHRFQIERRVPV